MPRPSRSYYSPGLDISERRINVDRESRRIAVRIASTGDVHAASQGGAKIRMPRTVNLEAAHWGDAELDDGTLIKVSTLPMGTADKPALHAPQGTTLAAAAEWYENTGLAIASVRYSMDEVGIRADGVLFDDVDDAKIDRLIASAPSGDWRTLVSIRKPTDFEHAPADFIGAVIVNQPGFSQTYSQGSAVPLRLAASANTIIDYEDGAMPEDENIIEAAVEPNVIAELQAAAEALNAQVAALVASSAPAAPSLEDRLAAIERIIPGIVDQL